jgi:hypothetical protein
MKKLLLFLIPLLMFGCAGMGGIVKTDPSIQPRIEKLEERVSSLEKFIDFDVTKLAEETGAKWSTYAARTEDMASGDDLMYRDVSDTSMAATGTQKRLPWSELLTQLYSAGAANSAGDVYTGNHDFSGADLELPQSQTPDTEGEIDWDGTNDKLQIHDGANVVTVAAKTKHLFALSIASPVDADHDDIKIKLIRAVTITAVYGDGTAGTSTVINCKEVDADGDDTDAVTIDGDWTITSGTQLTDTSFTNAALDANDWLQCDVGTVTGSVTMISLDIWGYEQ